MILSSLVTCTVFSSHSVWWGTSTWTIDSLEEKMVPKNWSSYFLVIQIDEDSGDFEFEMLLGFFPEDIQGQGRDILGGCANQGKILCILFFYFFDLLKISFFPKTHSSFIKFQLFYLFHYKMSWTIENAFILVSRRCRPLRQSVQNSDVRPKQSALGKIFSIFLRNEKKKWNFWKWQLQKVQVFHKQFLARVIFERSLFLVR